MSQQRFFQMSGLRSHIVSHLDRIYDVTQGSATHFHRLQVEMRTTATEVEIPEDIKRLRDYYKLVSPSWQLAMLLDGQGGAVQRLLDDIPKAIKRIFKTAAGTPRLEVNMHDSVLNIEIPFFVSSEGSLLDVETALTLDDEFVQWCVHTNVPSFISCYMKFATSTKRGFPMKSQTIRVIKKPVDAAPFALEINASFDDLQQQVGTDVEFHSILAFRHAKKDEVHGIDAVFSADPTRKVNLQYKGEDMPGDVLFVGIDSEGGVCSLSDQQIDQTMDLLKVMRTAGNTSW